MLLGGIGNVLAFSAITALVSVVVDSGSTRRVTAVDELGPILVRVLGATVRAIAIVVALLVSLVGIPWAVRQLVRYQVLVPVVVLDGERGGAALRRCGRLVAGSWWWLLAVGIAVQGVIALIAIAVPLVALVVFTSLPLWFFGALSSAVYVVFGPYAAVVIVLAYGNLGAIEAEALPQERDPVGVTTRPAE